MRRREFIITFLGGGAVWPLALRAQQDERVAKLGILMPYAEGDVEVLRRLTIFHGQLRDLGWIEGRNLEIEERWSSNDMQRIREDAAQLIALKPGAHAAPHRAQGLARGSYHGCR